MIPVKEVAQCFICKEANLHPEQAVMAFTVLDGGEQDFVDTFGGQDIKTVYVCGPHLQQVVINWYELYRTVMA